MAGDKGLVSYTNPLAFHPAKVTMMLAEKNLPHKTVPINLFGKQSLQPWFMKISPGGVVPAVTIDGKVILESLTICKTLDTLDGKPLGGDQVDRVFVDAFSQEINTFDGNLWAFAHTPAGLVGTLKSLDEYKKKVAAARAKENPDLKEVYDAKIASSGKSLEAAGDPAKVAACEKLLAGLLDTAEKRLGTDPSKELFLGGPAISIADCLFAPILFRVASMGAYKQLIQPRPAVAAYLKRMEARPSWKAAFGVGGSTWGKLSWFVPTLLGMKINSLFHRF